MIKLHIHLLIFRNFFVQYQVLLCCERSSSIQKEVVLRPMVDVGQHISKLIIIIIIKIKVYNNNNNNNKMFVKNYKNLGIINIIKIVLSIIEQAQIILKKKKLKY